MNACMEYSFGQHTRQAYGDFGFYAQIVRVFYCLQIAGRPVMTALAIAGRGVLEQQTGAPA
ncbi:MAG: hypothetical protein CMQ34_01375 [Gammaproteobacteria bacterium]|nr:hypothetical protein [Gammaproteobacteria bacterium]